MTDVTAINLADRIAVSDSGQLLKITTLIDDEGNETDDPSDAVVLVVMASREEWIVVHVDDFTKRRDT